LWWFRYNRFDLNTYEIPRIYMKSAALFKKTLFWLFTLVSGLLQAQVGLYNNSLTDTTLALVYTGANNDLVVTGVPDTRQLRIWSHTGKITPDDEKGNVFHFYNERLTTTDTFEVYNGQTFLLRKVFIQKQLQVPQITLGGIIDTVMKKEQILANPVLRIHYSDYYIYHYKIDKFEMELYPRFGEPFNFGITESDSLSQIQLDRIKSLEKGDRIKLFHVTLSCPGCRMRARLRPVTIRIE